MAKRPVGGKEVSVAANTELITNESCGTKDLNFISLGGFYIRNEDTKDIFVKINGSADQLLKPGEMFNLSGLTEVESCIVVTESKIRWGGLI
ncbi:hypothetical protein UT300012_32110 [Paraclostridium bifermentans]